jgi:catechol 2,3-dioxygenase-like lactoylglutathione lyase family enzyme
MIAGGNATISVADLDAAIRFYTGPLGLKLTNRLGGSWATVDAGPSYWTTEEQPDAGLVIGLRPASPGSPGPGTRGGVGFGFETYEPIEDVAAHLKQLGVQVEGEIVTFEAGKVAAFVDLDGLPSYAWEFSPDMLEGVDLGSDSNGADDGDSLLSGGHAIVYVNDMDEAIRFYVQTLGMKLTYRFENKFATMVAGWNLVIALHPRTPNTPIPGTKGSVTLGLFVDEPIDTALSRLAKRGVRITGRSEPGTPRAHFEGRAAEIEDPDGNVITLWEAQARESDAELAASGVAGRR